MINHTCKFQSKRQDQLVFIALKQHNNDTLSVFKSTTVLKHVDIDLHN